MVQKPLGSQCCSLKMHWINVRRVTALGLFLCLLSQHSFAQKRTAVDSLLQLFNAASNDEEQVRLLNEVSWEAFMAYDDSARFYGEEALRRANALSMPEQKLIAQLQLAEFHRVERNYSEAAKQLTAAAASMQDPELQQYASRYYLFKGNLAASQGQFEVAKSTYRMGLAAQNQQHHPALYLRLSGVLHRLGDVDGGAVALNKALELAIEQKDLPTALKASNNLGNFHVSQEEYNEAISKYKQSLAISQRLSDAKGASRAYLNMGNVCILQGSTDKAVALFLESSKIKEELGDQAGMAMIHNNIGWLYQEQERYEESLEYYRKSGDYYFSIVDTARWAETQLNIGNVLVSQKKTAEGIEALNHALESLHPVTQGSSIRSAQLNLGIAYNELGQYDVALDHLQAIEEEALVEEDEQSLVFLWNLKGASHFYLHQYVIAVQYYLKSYDLAVQLDLLKDQKSALYGLYEAERAANNHDASLRWLEQYLLIKDSIAATVLDDKLLDLQERYDAAEKAREIERLEITNEKVALENKLKDEQLNFTFLIIVVIVLVGALLLLYIIYVIREQRAKMREATVQNNERIDRLMSDQETAMFEAVLETQEKERKKLAQDIHDNLGSFLATLKYQHEKVVPESDDHQLVKNHQATGQLISKAFEEVRSISHQMHSGQVFDFRLDTAIKELVQRIQATERFQLTYQQLEVATDLPQVVEVNLYKVLQELLSNVMKHAQASEVVLQVNFTTEEVTLMLEDNGIGFDPKTSSGGIGWSNICDRLRLIHARYEVDSALNHGTTVVIVVPLHQNEVEHD